MTPAQAHQRLAELKREIYHVELLAYIRGDLFDDEQRQLVSYYEEMRGINAALRCDGSEPLHHERAGHEHS